MSKRLKKVLAVALAVVVAVASVPVAMAEYVEYAQYTVTGDDAKTYQYYSDGSQFRRYGNSDNAFMNVWVDNHYRFILKEETQKFYFVQNLRLQHQYELFQSKSTYFDKIGLYTGQALTGTPDVQPTEAQKEATNELIENYNLQEAFWTADNDNAQEKVELAGSAYVEGTIPSQYELHANAVSGGNKNYYWDGLSSFETSVGFQKTFYNVLSWYLNEDAKNSGVPTNYIVYGITLDVTDIRTLVAEVEKIKGILNNPAGYSAEQIEQYEKYIAAIPEGMVEGTTYYTQAQVDAVYNYITAAEGLADTEEYMYYRQKAFELISKDTNGNYNHSDVYTAESLAEFEAAFKAVDIGEQLPYPVSRQSEVDEATIAVKGTFSELVGVDAETQSSNGTTSDTVWETTDGIDVPSGDTANDHTVFKLSNTSYKFIQVTDDQKFSFAQELTGRAKNVSYNIMGAVRPNFESFTFDAACDGTNCLLDEASTVNNNTADFISRLDSSAKSTTNDVTSFKGWQYKSRSGDTVHGFTITDGILQQTLLTSDTQFMGSTTYHDFYGDATISFKGNSKETDVNGNRVVKDNEIDTSFYWKLTSSYDGTYYHAHIPVKILITDARHLIDLYEELNKFANFTSASEERALYTSDSVSAVRTALSSIPESMIYGTAYYTQEEVNAQYDVLMSAQENLESVAKADYTELDNTIAAAEALLNSGTTYTDATTSALQDMINTAKAVERDLSASSQAVVNEAATNLQQAISSLKEKADYSAYNSIKAELDAIIAAGNDGSYSEEAWQDFVSGVESADAALNKDLSVENQTAVDNAVTELTIAQTILSNNEKADYTKLDEAISEAEAILADGKTYTDGTRTALQTALDNAKAVSRDLLVGDQDTIDTLEASLVTATGEMKIKADYTALDEKIAEAEAVLSDGKIYTDSSRTALQTAIDNAKALDNDLAEENQNIINEALTNLETAKSGIEEKADYSSYNELKEKLDAIINAGNNGKYDEAAWQKFVSDVAAADSSLDKDLSKDDQSVIDTAIDELEAIEGDILSKEFADYSALENNKNTAEGILNSNEKYTSSSRKALEEALEAAENVENNLFVGDQAQIDSVSDALKDAIDGITPAADLSGYNEAKLQADAIINAGNEEMRYDEADWTEFVNLVANTDASLGADKDDIPYANQTAVNDAESALRNAVTVLDSNRHIFIKFLACDSSLIINIRVKYSEGMTFDDVSDIPELPEADAFRKYTGWTYNNGAFMNLTDVISGDVVLTLADEEIKIVTKSESGAVIDETKGLLKGLEISSTVEQLLNSLENNLTYIVVRDSEGEVVSNESIIATGMTVELISETDNQVVNEKVTVVVKGDINGDGLVNDEDFEKSRGMCLGETEYLQSDEAYFAANDTDDDGVLDVIDLFNISNMRFGNF